MVNVIFMSKETYSSLKALEYMCQRKNQLNIVAAVLRQGDNKIQKICSEQEIPIMTEEQILDKYKRQQIYADYIFSFYWKRVGKEILAIPTKGSINFHPGPLPEARGSGYHMAILEDWGYFGVTAHYMDEEFDTGPIIECRHFPISKDIVNKDLVRMTHEQLYKLFVDIVMKIVDEEMLETKEQTDGNYFSLQQLEESKLIDSNDRIEDIDRKIRAFWNPPYSGAQIEVNGKKYSIINEQILEWIADNIK